MCIGWKRTTLDAPPGGSAGMGCYLTIWSRDELLEKPCSAADKNYALALVIVVKIARTTVNKNMILEFW